MGLITSLIGAILGFFRSIINLFVKRSDKSSELPTLGSTSPSRAKPPSVGGEDDIRLRRQSEPSPKSEGGGGVVAPPAYGAPPPLAQPSPGTLAPPPPPQQLTNQPVESPKKQAKERSFDPGQTAATPVERSMTLPDDSESAADEPKMILHAPPPDVVPSPASEESAPTGTPPADATPAIPTEEVRFTAYYPKEATVETWYTLLVYAYIESALDAVRKDASRFGEDMANVPKESSATEPAKLARGTELTIVPTCDGVTFNPESITVKWVEDRHRAEFRFKADKSLAGDAGKGLISVYVGPLIIATLKFALLFSEAGQTPSAPVAMRTPAEVTSQIYKQEAIFVSYSHNDTSVVVACRDAYKALGYDVLIDIDNLRSGQHWSDELMRLIDRADIFQLFWSARSAQSDYVRQEWEYALKREMKEGFIRPVYWEKPLTPPPTELEALHFAYVPLTSDKQP